MDITTKIITALSQSDESQAVMFCADVLKQYGGTEISHGNIICRYGDFSEDKQTIVLDAHIDQVGFIVTSVTEQGFIKVANIGGIDKRLLPAQQVIIHGTRDIGGVFCSIPPHLAKSNQQIPEIEDMAIDTGLTGAELEEIVSLGDIVNFDVPCRELLNNRITGGALDDRSGVATILYALDLLKGRTLKYNLAIAFTTQEELGERGAKITANILNPDIAVAVDVSFAMAQGEDSKKCGYLGKGAMIGVSPSLSREISDELVKTAREGNLPYQIEVMNGLTSTNADQYADHGAKACTVSIPLRNMHTPAEVIDIADVVNTAKLLAEFIGE